VIYQASPRFRLSGLIVRVPTQRVTSPTSRCSYFTRFDLIVFFLSTLPLDLVIPELSSPRCNLSFPNSLDAPHPILDCSFSAQHWLNVRFCCLLSLPYRTFSSNDSRAILPIEENQLVLTWHSSESAPLSNVSVNLSVHAFFLLKLPSCASRPCAVLVLGQRFSSFRALLLEQCLAPMRLMGNTQPRDLPPFSTEPFFHCDKLLSKS